MIGGLWLAIWRGPWRLGGVLGIAAGLALWATAPPRPDVLIAPEARLVGVLGAKGSVLDHDRAQSFAAKTWLRRDGDCRGAGSGGDPARLTNEPAAGSPPASPMAGGSKSFPGASPTPTALTSLCGDRTILIARNGPDLTGPMQLSWEPRHWPDPARWPSPSATASCISALPAIRRRRGSGTARRRPT